jgi:tetratricopeptide (TPR) repeat protein
VGEAHGTEDPDLTPAALAAVSTIDGLAGVLRHLRRREARQHGAPSLTLRDLAAKTGWSRGVIGEYFGGRILPPTDRFDTLVQLLGADPDEQGRLATIRDRLEEARRSGIRQSSRNERPVPGGGLHQLPPTVAPFVGRAASLAEVDRLLPPESGTGDDPRIALITGMAGVGKTALALYWAHRRADHFPDGQQYLNLRGFDLSGSPATSAQAVRSLLEALGVTPDRIPSTEAAEFALYRGLLARRRMLLVLDNASDADQVRPLLPGGVACRVVVTSRNQLTGLLATDAVHLVRLDVFDQAESRELLTGRVGTARLAAEPEAADEIVAACARLPLALAIVAARAAVDRTFSLAALADELSRAHGSLDALTGEDPATDVRAVLSWSVRTLSPLAARTLRLLSVHPGQQLSSAAVASVVGCDLPSVRPLLAELIRANLLTAAAPDSYTWHDLLRAYAGETLRAAEPPDVGAAAVRRLVDHLLRSAHAADRRLDSHRDPIPLPPAVPGVVPDSVPDHATALAWFSRQLPVLLAAVTLAVGAGLDIPACRLARTMAHFLERQGHWRRWVELQHQVVAAARRAKAPAEEAHAHRSLGRALVRVGRTEEAAAPMTTARDLFHAEGDRAGEGRVELDLMWLACVRGRHADALEHSRRALAHFTDAEHPSGQGRAYNNLAWSLILLERPQEAVEHCRRSLELLGPIDDRFGLASTYDTLGYAQQRSGDDRAAADTYELAAAQWQSLGSTYQEADIMLRLGDCRAAVGNLHGARRAWQNALDLFTGLNHPDADTARSRLARSTTA